MFSPDLTVFQIFYLAEMGKTPEDLAKSIFVEKLHARGYEVLLLSEPLDEIFVQNIRVWKYVIFLALCYLISDLREGDLHSRMLPKPGLSSGTKVSASETILYIGLTPLSRPGRGGGEGTAKGTHGEVQAIIGMAQE